MQIPRFSAIRPGATPRRRGFTLVELLVVIGIISILLSMMMPALTKVRSKAKSVACSSNLRTCYQMLLMYANDNKGVLFPVGWGWDPNIPADKRWPVYVFPDHKWDTPVLTCPEDDDPPGKHSYVLNSHVAYKGIRFGRKGGIDILPSDIVLMGEKKDFNNNDPVYDYYMEVGDWDRVVEEYRHGIVLGSNYLFLDGHVSFQLPLYAKQGMDPWDPPGGATTQPTNDPS